MGVAKENEVELREVGDGECGAKETFRADDNGAEADADTVGEDGVGEDPGAKKIEEDGGMAEAGAGDGGVGPGGGVGPMCGGWDGAEGVEEDLADDGRASHGWENGSTV